MRHGWRQQRSVFRGVWPPAAARWTGTGPMPLLCFAVIEGTLMSMWMLTLVSTAALTIVVFASWRALAGPFWTMPDVSLFGPVMVPIAIPIVVLVTRPAAVFIPALCGPRFLFRTTPDVPPPHDAAVSSGGMVIRVTVGEDGFLIRSVVKDCPMHSALISGGGTPSAADTTLPRVDGTRGGKSGGHSGACEGFKPQPPSTEPLPRQWIIPDLLENRGR